MAMQLKIPTPTVPCTPGMCLVYVQDAFGIAPKYPTATAAWTASQYKHQDQNFPLNLWVPLWFALADDPNGHVALRQPDGTVWSSSHPTLTTPIHHASLTELESYYQGRLQYVGWTEDIEDVLVIATDTTSSPLTVSTATRDASIATAIPMASLQFASNSIRPELQNATAIPGLKGYTGHRLNHPAIEHKRISRQIEQNKQQQDRKRLQIKNRD